MECLKSICISNNEEETIKRNRVYRKYGNYNFYFLDTEEGLKEIKAIHIYEDNKELLKLNKPWFNNVSEVVFDTKIKYKKNLSFESEELFFIHMPNRKHIELFIPNSIVGFYKKGTEKLTGFYSKMDVFATDNEKFGCHNEEVLTVENRKFIKKIKDKCVNKKNVMFMK